MPTITATTNSTGDPQDWTGYSDNSVWVTLDKFAKTKWKPRKLTLDEILFDDEETYEQKKKEVEIDMDWPNNIFYPEPDQWIEVDDTSSTQWRITDDNSTNDCVYTEYGWKQK